MTPASHGRTVSKGGIAALVHVPRRAPGLHPVLCFLHGFREAARESESGPDRGLDRLLANESPPFHAENGSPFLRDFVVVSPQLEIEGRWSAADAARVDALMRTVVAQYGGDRARLFLTGFSYGGDAVFWFARSETPWAALWSVDPALQANTPRPPEGQRVWLHHGASRDHLREVVLRNFIGDAELEENGQARVVTNTGVPHVETSRAAYGDPRVYEWLRRSPVVEAPMA